MKIARTFGVLAVALALAAAGCARRSPGATQLRSGVRKLKHAITQESETPGPGYHASLQKAVTLLQAACRQRPRSASAHLNLGLAYWKQGRSDEAMAFLEKACSLSNSDPRPFEFLAAAYGEQQLWDRAREALDIANQRLSYSPRILSAMATTEYQAGSTELAEAFLTQAIKASDNYAPALYSMAVIQRDERGDEEKARAYFTQYLAAAGNWIFPDDASPLQRAALRDRIRIAQAYLVTEGDRPRTPAPESAAPGPGPPAEQEPDVEQEAAAAGTQDSPDGPDRPEASSRAQALQVWGRGLAAYNSGDMAEAIRLYLQALDLDPELASAAYNLGLAHRNCGHSDAARDAFRRAIRINRDFARAYYMLGLIYHEQQQSRLAREQLELALEKDAGFARAHFVLALICRKNGKTAAMRDHLQRFIRLAPDDPYAPRARELLER